MLIPSEVLLCLIDILYCIEYQRTGFCWVPGYEIKLHICKKHELEFWLCIYLLIMPHYKIIYHAQFFNKRIEAIAIFLF